MTIITTSTYIGRKILIWLELNKQVHKTWHCGTYAACVSVTFDVAYLNFTFDFEISSVKKYVKGTASK